MSHLGRKDTPGGRLRQAGGDLLSQRGWSVI